MKSRMQLPFLPDKIDTFHWHGDTFDIPDGALRIGSSELTRNQGFFINENILALQFHPEMTMNGVKKLIRAAGSQLSEEGNFIQEAYTLLSQDNLIAQNNSLIISMLDFLSSSKL